jgi:hypothetical protein
MDAGKRNMSLAIQLRSSAMLFFCPKGADYERVHAISARGKSCSRTLTIASSTKRS